MDSELKPSKTVRYCYWPNCDGSNKKDPTKILITVPKNKKEEWLELAGITKNYSLKTALFCCADHFKVNTDFKPRFKLKFIADPSLRNSGRRL
jgi:THAP domain